MYRGVILGFDAGRYWEMVQRLKVTHFYTAPTAIRLLLRYKTEFATKYDRSSLRILGCGKWVSISDMLN